jgi:hypothetical protein
MMQDEIFYDLAMLFVVIGAGILGVGRWEIILLHPEI